MLENIYDIGFEIKKLRENKDISQEDLAIELNISQSRLSKIESGKTKKIDIITLIAICHFFSISLSDFLEFIA